MLILDGNASQTQYLQLIDEAREHAMTMILFPPYDNHKLQPADIGLIWHSSIFSDKAITSCEISDLVPSGSTGYASN